MNTLHLLKKREISSRLLKLARLVAARAPEHKNQAAAHVSPAKLTYRGLEYHR